MIEMKAGVSRMHVIFRGKPIPFSRHFAALAFLAAGALLALMPPPASAGSFLVNSCRYVDDAKVDPIVAFGQVSGHMHTFRGNYSITDRSTLATLRAGGTTCRRRVDTDDPGSGDLSSYWVPSLIERDVLTTEERAVPIVTTATYYFGVHHDQSQIEPFPEGLKMLVGDGNATAEEAEAARANGSVVWSCLNGTPSEANKPSYCIDTDVADGKPPSLRLDLRFPSCWDGVQPSDAVVDPGRTNYDDSAHMALRVSVKNNNSSPWTCPATHPTPVPMLHVIWIWQTRGGPNVRLSTENQYGAHGDFFNGWDEQILARLVENCLRASVTCGSGDQAPEPPLIPSPLPLLPPLP